MALTPVFVKSSGQLHLVDRDQETSGNDIAETWGSHADYPVAGVFTAGACHFSKFYRGAGYVETIGTTNNAIPTSGQMKFSNFYGAKFQPVEPGPQLVVNNISSIDPNYTDSSGSSSTKHAYFVVGFAADTANNRIKARTYTVRALPSSSAASVTNWYNTADFITWDGDFFTSTPTIQYKWGVSASSTEFENFSSISLTSSGGFSSLGLRKTPEASYWAYGDRLASGNYQNLSGTSFRDLNFYVSIAASSGVYSQASGSIGNLSKYVNVRFKFTGGGQSDTYYADYSTAQNGSSKKLKLFVQRT